MLTYEKFLISPIKVRTLFIKKLLNELDYNLEETFIEDKPYKKALKDYQSNHDFVSNCVITSDVFYSLLENAKSAITIWEKLKLR